MPSVPEASSARSSTTVLATDSARPNTSPASNDQPQKCVTKIASAVAAMICTTAPGTAIDQTRLRSLNEKCSPTPNMRKMTPISASSGASEVSPTNPGVNGPTRMPASRYPTMGGRRSREAM